MANSSQPVNLLTVRSSAEFPWLLRFIGNWQTSTVSICSQREHTVTNLCGNVVDSSLYLWCGMLPFITFIASKYTYCVSSIRFKNAKHTEDLYRTDSNKNDPRDGHLRATCVVFMISIVNLHVCTTHSFSHLPRL